MKKHLTKIALGFCFLSMAGYAQERRFQPCNTFAAMEERFAKDPAAKASYDAGQAQLHQEFVNRSTMGAKAAAAFQYTIPVVFHVLHTGGGENVSDTQVEALLASINRDYAKQGADVPTIAQPFQTLYIPSDIVFVLAKKDPAGNGITGIEHLYDSRTLWEQGNTNFYSGLTWNPTQYMNIIVVKDILESGPVSGGQVGGYTYKPGTWPTGAPADAIVILSSFVTNATEWRGVSHEIGHWLNLGHTFGNTNNPGAACGDDGLFDTPPTKGNYNACPTSASGNVCAATTNTAYAAGQQNVENIMDYSNCPKNFTTDQTNAMRTALASSVSNRQNLWQPANLAATDIAGTGGLYPPKCEFLSTNNSYTVCAGGSLTMKDFSYNGTISNYAWSADNGATAANATASLTVFNFPTVGVTNVNLTINNAGGSSNKTRTVYVMDGTAMIAGPAIEGFEVDGIPQNWHVNNANSGTSTWGQTWDAHYENSGAFMIEGAMAGGSQVDVLESPIYDLQSVPNASFTFALAYAQKQAGHNDVLKIQATKDCGGTWMDIVSLGGNQMQANSGGINSIPFIPSVPEEWKIYSLNDYSPWNSILNETSVTFRFVFTEGAAGYGNNIFIDAINLGTSGGTGLNKLAREMGFNIYPNPSSGATNIKLNLHDASDVSIQVQNLLGQTVIPATSTKLNAGGHILTVNQDQTLANGIYLVNVSVNGAVISTKLVIE